jgi:CRISPR-associated endonuclease/helicase Cas3
MQNVAGSMANFNALVLEDGYVWNRHQWQEEQEIGTRLVDEPTLNVALLSRNGDGGLTLWADGERHADMLSQLKLRQSQAGKLASLPQRYQAQWEALQERYKALCFVQPWLAEADKGCRYDYRWGLLLSEEQAAPHVRGTVGGMSQ